MRGIRVIREDILLKEKKGVWRSQVEGGGCVDWGKRRIRCTGGDSSGWEWKH